MKQSTKRKQLRTFITKVDMDMDMDMDGYGLWIRLWVLDIGCLGFYLNQDSSYGRNSLPGYKSRRQSQSPAIISLLADRQRPVSLDRNQRQKRRLMLDIKLRM
jgi:hypothetical protein